MLRRPNDIRELNTKIVEDEVASIAWKDAVRSSQQETCANESLSQGDKRDVAVDGDERQIPLKCGSKTSDLVQILVEARRLVVVLVMLAISLGLIDLDVLQTAIGIFGPFMM